MLFFVGCLSLDPVCRSLLSDLIHLQDVKELCSVLVVLCEEAARTIAGNIRIIAGYAGSWLLRLNC